MWGLTRRMFLSPSSLPLSSPPPPPPLRTNILGGGLGGRLGGGLEGGEFSLFRRCLSSLPQEEKEILAGLEERVNWLATYMIHHGNQPKKEEKEGGGDGMKVGGHQASSSSLSTILTLLYFKFLRPQDRVAVKPHAGPAYHAIHYLMDKQKKENLENFRGLGGVQSYPSITKDLPEVDFSTGSVGLGATTAMFSALIQDYLHLKGLPLSPPSLFSSSPSTPTPLGRMISIVGDAELDEGSVFEGLMESWKLNIKNSWWIIDYNRQSLDSVTKDNHFRLIDRMFSANKWQVMVLKYGKRLEGAFRGPGGKALRRWLNDIDNFTYSTLSFQGGKAFRTKIQQDIGSEPGIAEFLSSHTDESLFSVLTNLAGHDFDVLLEAFEEAAKTDKPTCFIAYTMKGYGLPIKGHRDNHGLLLSQKQIDSYREQLSIPLGQEFEKIPNVAPKRQKLLENYIENAPYNIETTRNYTPHAEVFDIPEVLPCRIDKKMSTQAAFGQIMLEIGKSTEPFAERVITMAPDVTTSTNLSGFLNLRGLFSHEEKKDLAKEQKVMSMNKWDGGPHGQHVELGIAEHNLFSLLTAAGHSSFLFGQRLFPIGTVYDPFISRALDQMNYGCYIDSRFMLVATPSGLTLSREGGAHQSIYTPSIGMGQPGLVHFEPAYADELQICMAWGLKHMQKPDGSSIYLRLSTRPLDQIENRQFSAKEQQDLLCGAYWRAPPQTPPTPKSKRGRKKKGEQAKEQLQPTILLFCGAVAPEALQAYEQLTNTHPHLPLSLLQVLSPDLLFSDFQERGENSHIGELLREGGGREAKVVCVYDAHPSCLGWVGGVVGQKVRSLGVSQFGQCGALADLYRVYGLDKDSIVRACLGE